MKQFLVEPDKIWEAYSALDDALRKNDMESSLALSEAILDINPDEREAFECKLYSLIHLEKFDQILLLLDNLETGIASKYSWERAYSLYQKRNYNQVLDIINSVKNPSISLLHLKAQTLYKIEDDQSFDIYNKIFDSKSENSPEIYANLAATLSKRKQSEALPLLEKLKKNENLLRNSYDYYYNKSFIFSEFNDWDSALENIEISEKICRENKFSSEEEFKMELNPIMTQKGYLLQEKGLYEESYEIYRNILGIENSEFNKEQNRNAANGNSKNLNSASEMNIDSIVEAICLNNIGIFRVEKYSYLNKLNHFEKDSIQSKLSRKQKDIILFNRIIILINLGKIEKALPLVERINSESSLSLILRASAMLKQDQAEKALEFLKNSNDNSYRVKLAISQIYLNQQKINECIETLSSIEEIKNEPALISTLIQLNLQVGKSDEALEILEKFIKSMKSQYKSNKHLTEMYINLLLQKAKINAQNKLWNPAVEALNQALELKPNDINVKIQLIKALSHVDPAKSQMYRLDPLPDDGKTIEIDELEKIAIIDSVKRTTEIDKKGTNPVVPVHKKRRRKRKNKPCKNEFVPGTVPDPDRWLPSNRRNNRNRGRAVGHQGAAASENLIINTNTTTKTTQPTKAIPKGFSRNIPKKAVSRRK